MVSTISNFRWSLGIRSNATPLHHLQFVIKRYPAYVYTFRLFLFAVGTGFVGKNITVKEGDAQKVCVASFGPLLNESIPVVEVFNSTASDSGKI